jgi:CIC family chloride channel protein
VKRLERLGFPAALALVAVGAAAFAIAFRLSLGWVYAHLFGATTVVEAMAGLPLWLRFVVPLAGGFLAGAIAWWRRAPAQGVSNVMEAVALGRVHLSLRATGWRVASSWTAIAGGMSIGREGPLIEFGGSLGASLGRRLRTSLDETRVLVAAGTAAGFAAAYNTPFAAVLFVVETIVGVAAPSLLLPAMCTTLVATGISRVAVGPGPIYGQRTFGLDSYLDLAWFAALGAVAALAAFGFKQALRATEGLAERSGWPQPLRATVGGALVGAVAMGLPQVAGNGYEPLHAMLDVPLAVPMLALLALAKVFTTSASVASGVPGGIFTPMLLVGAALGSAWAQALDVGGAHSAVGAFALVGMAATTAASIHAPLTAAVMIFEVSGDYALVLPLLLATAVATAVSRALGSESVYERELRKRGLGWDVTLDGRITKEHGSPGVDVSTPR